MNAIGDSVQQQRTFFQSGETQLVTFRIQQLTTLKQVIQAAEAQILEALAADLRKPAFEAMGELLGVVAEINYALKHLRQWVKPQRIATPPLVWPATAKIQAQPLGVVLIIGPWNYPLQLTLIPLVGAIAAGNCAILKPSELAPHTSEVISKLISQHFDSRYIQVIEGGIDTSQALLAEPFDHIFFTGSTAVGKQVMVAAAQHLTPVTLELGGKSPCIVDVDVPLELAARRIAWGKFINAGQTCIAPDYLLVHRQIKADFLVALQKAICDFYGENPASSPDYSRIISAKHFDRLVKLLETSQIVAGGETNASDRYIAPTIVDAVSWSDPIMQDEIFGPILPVLEYDQLAEAIAAINQRPKPLALYLFSNDRQHQNQVLQATSSGGVCINDTIMHVVTPVLPFGGIGASGMGRYHGKASFDTFSNYRSVMSRPFQLENPLRYAPYGNKLKWLKRLMG